MYKIAILRVWCAVVVLIGTAVGAAAQSVDLTLFAGKAFPIYDERLTFRPSTPSVPGVDISVDGSPVITADGGAVFGGALAFEFGVLGIEGRLDATEVDGYGPGPRVLRPERTDGRFERNQGGLQ